VQSLQVEVLKPGAGDRQQLRVKHAPECKESRLLLARRAAGADVNLLPVLVAHHVGLGRPCVSEMTATRCPSLICTVSKNGRIIGCT
jgi:hypothetical protein